MRPFFEVKSLKKLEESRRGKEREVQNDKPYNNPRRQG